MAHPLTLLASAACDPDPDTAGLSPALHLATTFERETDGTYPKGYRYGREGNPTRTRLERTLADLEGASACRCFSSGLAACHAVLQALPANARILIPDDVYHGFRRLVDVEFKPRGMSVRAVDMSDRTAVGQALDDQTDLIWVETPSNPLLKITDMRHVAELGARAGAKLVVDGTWTTPLLQRSMDLGADVVVHSLTKYISGHSDVLGGAVLTARNDSFFDRIADIQVGTGAVLDPFSSWLTLRGMRSLGVRIAHQCASASTLARFLAKHPRVKFVHYPGLVAHPGHETARTQMSDFGAMLSLQIDGDRDDALEIAARTRVFTRATSLGGTESLIEHRASMEGPGTSTPENLLRLSIGLEFVDDLVEDLGRALA